MMNVRVEEPTARDRLGRCTWRGRTRRGSRVVRCRHGENQPRDGTEINKIRSRGGSAKKAEKLTKVLSQFGLATHAFRRLDRHGSVDEHAFSLERGGREMSRLRLAARPICSENSPSRFVFCDSDSVGRLCRSEGLTSTRPRTPQTDCPAMST